MRFLTRWRLRELRTDLNHLTQRIDHTDEKITQLANELDAMKCVIDNCNTNHER